MRRRLIEIALRIQLCDAGLLGRAGLCDAIALTLTLAILAKRPRLGERICSELEHLVAKHAKCAKVRVPSVTQISRQGSKQRHYAGTVAIDRSSDV